MAKTWLAAIILGGCLWIGFQVAEEHVLLKASEQSLAPLRKQKAALQLAIAEEEDYLKRIRAREERTMMGLARERGYHGAGEINWRVLRQTNQWWYFTK